MDKKPFLYLLNNINKLDIDEAMIPLFKEMLEKIEVYFENNNLIDSIDYISFFNEYLINDSENKLKFRVKVNEDMYNSDGPSNYNFETKTLIINDYELDLHKLCHEFIHLLVWRQKDNINKEKYEHQKFEIFFDEGATENLARNITDFKPNENQNVYNENVSFVKFLESMFTKEEFNKKFLSGKSLFETYFDNNENIGVYSICLSYLKDINLTNYFYEHNSHLNPKNQDNLFLEIERKLENYILENYDYKCDTIQDLINNVKMCAKRPVIDKCDLYHNIYSNYQHMIQKLIKNIDFGEKFTLELQTNNLLRKLMEAYDELYINDDEDFVKITLEGEQEGDEYELFIDSNGQPIKSDLYFTAAGSLSYKRFKVYDNSNEDDRKTYTCDFIDFNNIDYSARRKNLNEVIEMLLDELFSINNQITIDIINSILKKYFNESLETINSEKMPNIKEQLQYGLDKHLYLRIGQYLDEYFLDKQL